MYIPKHFAMDPGQVPSFIAKHPFGQLITSATDSGSLVGPPGLPGNDNEHNHPLHITHLPFVCAKTEPNQFSSDEQGKRAPLRLLGHLAAENPHANFLDGALSTAVFTGGHGYVSPKYYDGLKNVPTWNYSAVHIRGVVRTLPDAMQAEVVLKEMIQAFEPAYSAQWDELPKAYRSAMLKGIVAFELVAERVEGKVKHSQNRSAQERSRLRGAFDFMDDL